jgi:hypothetical protein
MDFYTFFFSWQEILNLCDPTTTLSTLIFLLAVADKHFRCTVPCFSHHASSAVRDY